MTDMPRSKGCDHDTDGDGNCHLHPSGCLYELLLHVADEMDDFTSFPPTHMSREAAVRMLREAAENERHKAR